MYKLIYEEYGEEIVVTSTEPDPLLLIIREMFQNQPDFDLIYYGKEEEKKPYKSTRGTGHKLPIKKENEND